LQCFTYKPHLINYSILVDIILQDGFKLKHRKLLVRHILRQIIPIQNLPCQCQGRAN